MEKPDTEHVGEVYAAAHPEIVRYLDMRGRVNSWPLKKQATRDIILSYLAAQFEMERSYTEKEVNEQLSHYVVFNDPATVRRALCDYSYLKRTRDGARYWRELR